MLTTRTSRLRTKQVFSLDMTPMADIAFLLVAFFMLASRFLYPDPVVVKLPQSSGTRNEWPASSLVLTIAEDGRLFFNLDGAQIRMALLEQLGKKYGVNFSEKQRSDFAGMGSIGMDMSQLSAYLNLSANDRDRVKQAGIPMHQFVDWLEYARKLHPTASIFIKADETIMYPTLKAVIELLQAHEIPRFRLMTNIEPYDKEEK